MLCGPFDNTETLGSRERTVSRLRLSPSFWLSAPFFKRYYLDRNGDPLRDKDLSVVSLAA